MNSKYSESEIKQLIKVVGVGGGGGNAVTKMTPAALSLACPSSYVIPISRHLTHSPVEDKIMIGPTVTKGLGDWS